MYEHCLISRASVSSPEFSFWEARETCLIVNFQIICYMIFDWMTLRKINTDMEVECERELACIGSSDRSFYTYQRGAFWETLGGCVWQREFSEFDLLRSKLQLEISDFYLSQERDLRLLCRDVGWSVNCNLVRRRRRFIGGRFYCHWFLPFTLKAQY